MSNPVTVGARLTLDNSTDRRDGSPFFNLLCLQPLKDSSGIVRYFLGGQIDVTSSISSLADPFSSRPHSSTQLKLSPAVRKHQEALLAEIRKHKADEVDGGKESSDTLHVMMPRSEDGFERKGKVKGKQSAEESGGPNGTSGNGGAKNWVEKTLKKVASSASGGAKKGDQVGMTDEEHERMEAARQPLMVRSVRFPFLLVSCRKRAHLCRLTGSNPRF